MPAFDLRKISPIFVSPKLKKLTRFQFYCILMLIFLLFRLAKFGTNCLRGNSRPFLGLRQSLSNVLTAIFVAILFCVLFRIILSFLGYARRLFFKALDAVTYRQDEIFGRFVQFEREEGTREQLDLALARVNAKATEYNAWMEQQKYSKTKPKMGRTNEMNGQKTAKKKDKKEKGNETSKRAQKKANGRQEEKRQKAQKEEKEGKEEEEEEERENMEEERGETSQVDVNECTTATFEASGKKRKIEDLTVFDFEII